MTYFTRAAPWLRHLYTPSKTKAANPGILSNDVALTQDYAGGGYPLIDPQNWVESITTAAVAAADTVLATTGIFEVCRVLAVSYRVSAGVRPDTLVDILTGGVAVAIGDQQDGATPPPLPTFAKVVILTCPIMGPSAVLRGRHSGGDAATVVTWEVYKVIAPLGTVFYV